MDALRMKIYLPRAHNSSVPVVGYFNLRYYNAITRCDQIASSSSMTIYDHKTSANQKAFNSVLDAIELQILKQQKMIAQTMLCTLFREELSHSGYPSEDYRSCKLKDRIIRNEINNRIGFVNVDQQHIRMHCSAVSL